MMIKRTLKILTILNKLTDLSNHYILFHIEIVYGVH